MKSRSMCEENVSLFFYHKILMKSRSRCEENVSLFFYHKILMKSRSRCEENVHSLVWLGPRLCHRICLDEVKKQAFDFFKKCLISLLLLLLVIFRSWTGLVTFRNLLFVTVEHDEKYGMFFNRNAHLMTFISTDLRTRTLHRIEKPS